MILRSGIGKILVKTVSSSTFNIFTGSGKLLEKKMSSTFFVPVAYFIGTVSKCVFVFLSIVISGNV